MGITYWVIFLMSIVKYTATTLGNQTIDTFDLPIEKNITYYIHTVDSSTSVISNVTLSHNGNTTIESQVSTSLANTRPLVFTSTISNNVGLLQANPTTIPSTFTVNRVSTVANLYSEHTLSGYNIVREEGVGLYLDNMTIRQSNNNYFGYANTFLVNNTLGPIDTLSELYDVNDFQPYNGSQLSINNTEISVASSGQVRNCQYLLVPVVGGQQYRLTANVYFSFNQIQAKGSNENEQSPPRITIGSDVTLAEYASKEFTDTLQNIEILFTAPESSSFVYINVGFGAIGTVCHLNNISIRRRVPFHTFNQNQGTVYLNWNAVSSNSTIASFQSPLGNNTIRIDTSNNIFINTYNLGAQQPNNKLAVAYSSISNTILSFNNNASLYPPIYFNKRVLLLNLSALVVNFTYTPSFLTTSELMGLTRG